MAEYKYAFSGYKDNMARAVGINLAISTKQSVAICKAIRGKMVERALTILTKAINMEDPIPFTRFNSDMGHKKGMGAGRNPVKACTMIKKVVENARTNAQSKGLSSGNLKIIHICPKKGSGAYRYGRQYRRNAKRSTVEIVVEECAPAEKKGRQKSQQKAPEKKAATEEKKATVEKKTPLPAVKKEAMKKHAVQQEAPKKTAAEPVKKESSTEKKPETPKKKESPSTPAPQKQASPKKEEKDPSPDKSSQGNQK